MLDDGLNLLLNILCNFIPFLKQILEYEVGDSVFNYTPTNFDDGIIQVCHTEVSQVRMIDVIVYARINDYLNVIYIVFFVPLVIRFCFGRSITDILQSISIIY